MREWPENLPPLNLIRHARARRLKLSVTATAVRLTVPIGCNREQVEQFLAASQAWIMRSWQQQQLNLQKHAQSQQTSLPDIINFFNSQQFRVSYMSQKQLCKIDWTLQHVVISALQPERGLAQFIQQYAERHLLEYLAELALATGLQFQQGKIKRPKTRWGSCSSQQNIMLHAALVLLPLPLVRYVCVHELAHTIQMNHGQAFWQLVAQHELRYLQLRQQLKHSVIPTWCYA